jgi:hypothetical protein
LKYETTQLSKTPTWKKEGNVKEKENSLFQELIDQRHSKETK